MESTYIGDDRSLHGNGVVVPSVRTRDTLNDGAVSGDVARPAAIHVSMQVTLISRPAAEVTLSLRAIVCFVRRRAPIGTDLST